MREAELQTKIMTWLKAQAPDVWAVKIADRHTAGIPDILLCVKGLFVAVELKVGKNNTTRLQDYTLNAIRQADGIAVVCRSLEEVQLLVETTLECCSISKEVLDDLAKKC